MIIEKDQTYIIEDTQTILRGVTFKGALVLKDIKASYTWDITTPEGEKYWGEYFEGYKITENLLEPIQSYAGNGKSKKCIEHRFPVEVDTLRLCEVETITVDLNG